MGLGSIQTFWRIVSNLDLYFGLVIMVQSFWISRCSRALGTSSHLRERLGVVRQRKLPLSLQGVFFKGYNL